MLDINKVYLEDCREGIEKLDNDSVDLIVTSPPYFTAKEYSVNGEASRLFNSYSEYKTFLKIVFEKISRALKPGKICCVNLSPIIIPRKNRQDESRRIPIPFHFVDIMESLGYVFLEDIIWVKPEGSAIGRNKSFHSHRQPVAYKPNIVTEYVLVFRNHGGGLIDKIVRNYSGEQKQKSLVNGLYDTTNVWYINPDTSNLHPAPFPVELSNRLVRYYSYVDDIILDPFMGSGTTAVSCIKYERNYIGFEYSLEYWEMSNKRIRRLPKPIRHNFFNYTGGKLHD